MRSFLNLKTKEKRNHDRYHNRSLNIKEPNENMIPKAILPTTIKLLSHDKSVQSEFNFENQNY